MLSSAVDRDDLFVHINHVLDVHTLTYLDQGCSSLNPSTSRALRLDKGASYSPSSLVIGVFGHASFKCSVVGTFNEDVVFVALKT